MAAPRLAESAAFASFLSAHEEKSLLRFLTCGSVDDGKSTLIGRLLYDTKRLFEDQLARAQADSRQVRHRPAATSISRCCVDGLEAEREQGITIDVAYRYFATDKRRFIVADTPGHEQYTRNMATGASNADLAVILVDAAQGRAHPDAAPRLHRLAARHPPRRARRQQDRPRRFRPGALRRHRRATSASSRTRSTSRASSPSRCRRATATTSSRRAANTPWYRGPSAARPSRDRRGRGARSGRSRSACRCNG